MNAETESEKPMAEQPPTDAEIEVLEAQGVDDRLIQRWADTRFAKWVAEGCCELDHCNCPPEAHDDEDA